MVTNLKRAGACLALFLFTSWCLESCGQSLSADGPYVIYAPDQSARIIRVDNKGKVQDQHLDSLPLGTTLQVTDPEGRYPFEVKLRPIERPAWDDPQPEKIFVMSDPHGKLDCVVSLLQGNGVIDKQLRWSFGKNQLVVIGDVFDRGNDVVQILWLLYKLEGEAAEAGGQLSFLLGNHEALVLSGDLRYVKKKYTALAERLKMGYPSLLGADTELGRWLGTRNTMQRVGRFLFVHAGLGKAFYEQDLSIPTVNETVSRSLFLTNKERAAVSPLTKFLYGNVGPIWYRGMVRTEPKYQPLAGDTLALLLKRYAVDRIVVGHTIFDDVSFFYDGRVIDVNVDNEENREVRRGRGILIEGDRITVVKD